MQNKLYIIQFFLTTQRPIVQSVPELQLWFSWNSRILQSSWISLTEVAKKFKLLEKIELTE